jgi:hypothetical protein
MNMKMLIKLVCVNAFIASLAVLAVVASTPGTIVSIGDFELDSNSTIKAPVMVKNVEEVGCGELNISFDPSVVHVTDVSDGEIGTTTFNINNETGWVYVNAFSAIGQSGDVAFAYLTLKAVGNEGKVSYLNISVISLYNTSYGDIAYTTDDGKIIVKTASSETPAPSPPPPPSGGSTSSGGGGGGDIPLITPAPTLTPTPLSTPTEKAIPTLTPTPTPSLIHNQSPLSTPFPTKAPSQQIPSKKRVPGFEGAFAIAILFGTAYLLIRRQW